MNNPVSLTYVFLDAGSYSASDKDAIKTQWIALAQEYGAESRDDPETIVQKEVTHDLLFLGVSVTDRTAFPGLVAAFSDRSYAEGFMEAAHRAFDAINYTGAKIHVLKAG